eukprot:scaffold2587_cov41-Phaeocystis_antarctica.AAC.3
MQGGATARTGAWVRVHGAAPPPHLHAQRLQLCLGLDVCVGGEQPLQSEGARLVVRRVTLGPPLLGTASDRAEEVRVRGSGSGRGRGRVRREQQVLGARGQAQRRRRDRGGGAELLRAIVRVDLVRVRVRVRVKVRVRARGRVRVRGRGRVRAVVRVDLLEGAAEVRRRLAEELRRVGGGEAALTHGQQPLVKDLCAHVAQLEQVLAHLVRVRVGVGVGLAHVAQLEQ